MNFIFSWPFDDNKYLPTAYMCVYGKVKWSRHRPGVAHGVGRGIALLFPDRGIRRGWVVSSTPRPHFTPRERPGTHFTGGWVGSRAGLDGRKISLPPGFDPRTVSSVAIPTELTGYVFTYVWKYITNAAQETLLYAKWRFDRATFAGLSLCLAASTLTKPTVIKFMHRIILLN